MSKWDPSDKEPFNVKYLRKEIKLYKRRKYMKISISKYTAVPGIINLGTVGSYGIETLEFSFDEAWQGTVKEASFYPGEGEAVVVILDGDCCSVPPEMTAVKGRGRIAVTGIAEGRRIISAEIEAFVEHTCQPATTPSEGITPTEKEQMLTLMQQSLDNSQQALEYASAVEDGEDGTSMRAFTTTTLLNAAVKNYKAKLLLVLWAGNDATSYTHTNGSITLNKGDVWQFAIVNNTVASATKLCNINGYSPIKGVDYNDGRSAYESAVANGYEGAEEQWLASLKGSNGISVTDAVVDADGSLLITLSSGEVLNAGTLDIPKSKEYELIRSYRLTEEDVANSVKGFAFNTDYNGNEFSLKSIIVYCYFPAASSNGTFELAIKNSDGKLWVIYKRAEMLATSDRYVKIDMSLKGYWTGTGMVTTTDTGTATAVDSYARNSITNSAGYINLASNIALPLGTTIEIYGVRA